VIYRSRGFSEDELDALDLEGQPVVDQDELGWHALVLATDDDTRLPFPLPTGPARAALPQWATATGLLLVQDVDGYHLYDLDTGETLPSPPIDVTPRAFRLSPDGDSVATVSVTADGFPVADLAVYDLATGARTLERHVDIAGSIVQLSYDGSVAAVASSHDGTSGVVTVVDLQSDARRTIDAYGGLA
jgi:hypothetical protein